MINDVIKSLSTMTAVVLAGGLGSRLQSVIGDRSKVVAPVRGRPFIATLLEQLESAGIRRAVFCTGHLAESIEALLGDRFGELRITYSRESSPLGTAGALRLAIPLITSEMVLVMNGDSHVAVDFVAMLAWHRARGARATIALADCADAGRFGRVELDADDCVARFREKSPDAGPGWINAGVYLMRTGLLETIPPGQHVSLEREMFPDWIGHGLFGYRTAGRVVDIGTPDSYADAQQNFDPTFVTGVALE